VCVKAAAELAQRLGTGGTVYLERAVSVWNWFEASGMINDELLVSDGLDPNTCRVGSGEIWSYSQGVLLGGLVALSRATGEDRYLERARELADASSTSASLNVDGVLTEPCEQDGCDVNGLSFKGIYVRNLGELDRALDDHPYNDYLVEQASIAYEHDRTADNEYGLHWAGRSAESVAPPSRARSTCWSPLNRSRTRRPPAHPETTRRQITRLTAAPRSMTISAIRCRYPAWTNGSGR